MKKIVLLACCLLFANLTFADTGAVGETVYSYYLRNNTASSKNFLIPTTSIRPGIDKLKGYDARMINGAASAEIWISIFDATDSTMSGECLGEREANDKESIHDYWIAAKKISNGVAVTLGAYTEAQIYFVKE